SPHPNDFSDRVIEAMAEVEAVCEYVHLPAQSGSDRVLKRMLRRYTRAGYLEVGRKLRARVPHITIATDIIVGFPGESDADFDQSLSLVREVEFDGAFTFRFSPREGTPATRLGGPLGAGLAAERLARLIAVVREVSRVRNAAVVGETFEALVERP